jgi:hypothetical protein
MIALIIDFFLQKLFYYDFFVLLFILFIVYQAIIFLCQGISFGKWIFGIKIVAKSNTLYMLYKLLIIIILPLLLFRFLGIEDLYALFVDIFVFYLFLLVFSIIIVKKTLWAYLAKVAYLTEYQAPKNVLCKFICLILIISVGFFTIKYFNNKNNRNEDVLFGFNFPYKFKKYPCKKQVKPYIDFLNTNSMPPKDYILDLFKNYDIVILQETYHGESTQWDMIFDIVSDSVFINSVGNIFTEYGSAIHQNKIDTFLNTVFLSDTILEQETACLMNYMSGGFYYFIKNLNILNSKLPDTLKIREHYTDVIDWDYFPSFLITQADNRRDSLMAQITVDWYYKQVADGERHKCLVVTNTRHAMGYNGGIEKVKNEPKFFHLTDGNQGQYIWEKFPKKTATVMQIYNVNSRSFFLPVSQQINKGKWDLAFELNGNKPTAFNLKNSPFGNDFFDAYPLRGAKTTLKYEDIFTGLIFNKPFMEQNSVQYPFTKFAVEQEAKIKNLTESTEFKQRIRYYDNEANLEKNMRWATAISVSNFAGIFVFLSLASLSIFSSLTYLFASIFKKF